VHNVQLVNMFLKQSAYCVFWVL